MKILICLDCGREFRSISGRAKYCGSCVKKRQVRVATMRPKHTAKSNDGEPT